jgi:uncharacterized membrane protein
MALFVQFAATLVAMVVIDAVWLGVVMRGFYQAQLGPLMREPILWPAAIVFYVLYAAVLTALVTATGARWTGFSGAVMTGALVGLAAYGTYDFTNLATLKGFPVALAAVDLAWGTALTALVAGIGWWAGRLAGG